MAYHDDLAVLMLSIAIRQPQCLVIHGKEDIIRCGFHEVLEGLVETVQDCSPVLKQLDIYWELDGTLERLSCAYAMAILRKKGVVVTEHDL